MGFILQLIFFFFDPFGLIRKFFIRPTCSLANSMFEQFRGKTKESATALRDLTLRIGIISFTIAIIIWGAIFMYVAFYYAYMPAISHTRPVHMQFKSCIESGEPCSFPHAHISLTKKQQLLMVGQSYKIVVTIDMPESPSNQELGMFMVCAEMRDQESLLRGHSCRSAMMRYRSHLIQTLTTWTLSPFYVLGLKEEFQKVPVEIFPHYIEERQHPVTDVYIEIQSQKIQFYSVTLYITADFTGLRYIMFNWPICTAVICVGTNLVLILIIFALSWYNWPDTKWIKDAQKKYQNSRTRKLKRLDSNKKNNNSQKCIKLSEKDDENVSYSFSDDSYNENKLEELESDFVVNATSEEEKSVQRTFCADKKL